MSFALTWNAFLDSFKMRTPLQRALVDISEEIHNGTSPLLEVERVPHSKYDILYIKHIDTDEGMDNSTYVRHLQNSRPAHPVITRRIEYCVYWEGCLFAYFHKEFYQYDNGPVTKYCMSNRIFFW